MTGAGGWFSPPPGSPPLAPIAPAVSGSSPVSPVVNCIPAWVVGTAIHAITTVINTTQIVAPTTRCSRWERGISRDDFVSMGSSKLFAARTPARELAAHDSPSVWSSTRVQCEGDPRRRVARNRWSKFAHRPENCQVLAIRTPSHPGGGGNGGATTTIKPSHSASGRKALIQRGGHMWQQAIGVPGIPDSRSTHMSLNLKQLSQLPPIWNQLYGFPDK